MKRPRLLSILCFSITSMLALAVACGSDDPETKPPSGANAGQGGKGNTGGKKEKEKEIKTQGQAVKALLLGDDIQISESLAGGAKTSTPEVKKFAEGLVGGYKKASDRLKALVKEKKIATESSSMLDRLKFQSEGSISHIQNVMPSMVDNAYITRVMNTHKELLTNIDEAFAPVIKDDDLKAELATIKSEATTHLQDAEGLADILKGQETPFMPEGGAARPPNQGAGGQGGGAEAGAGPAPEPEPAPEPQE